MSILHKKEQLQHSIRVRESEWCVCISSYMNRNVSLWPILGICLAVVDGFVRYIECEHCVVYLAGVGLCCMFGW